MKKKAAAKSERSMAMRQVRQVKIKGSHHYRPIRGEFAWLNCRHFTVEKLLQHGRSWIPCKVYVSVLKMVNICIVLYCTVLYCIVLYCVVLYCIVLCCIVLYCVYIYIYYVVILCKYV
jgi:hypothetical protein